MFADLVNLRWKQAQKRLNLSSGTVLLTWEVSPNYPHFDTPRGYGVTFPVSQHVCHMAFAPKILNAPLGLQDAVLRHEIGHVLDLCLSSDVVDAWADNQLPPPQHAEIRADALAELIWGDPIYYDTKLFIQTLDGGIRPRPEHLGK